MPYICTVPCEGGADVHATQTTISVRDPLPSARKGRGGPEKRRREGAAALEVDEVCPDLARATRSLAQQIAENVRRRVDSAVALYAFEGGCTDSQLAEVAAAVFPVLQPVDTDAAPATPRNEPMPSAATPRAPDAPRRPLSAARSFFASPSALSTAASTTSVAGPRLERRRSSFLAQLSAQSSLRGSFAEIRRSSEGGARPYGLLPKRSIVVTHRRASAGDAGLKAAAPKLSFDEIPYAVEHTTAGGAPPPPPQQQQQPPPSLGRPKPPRRTSCSGPPGQTSLRHKQGHGGTGLYPRLGEGAYLQFAGLPGIGGCVDRLSVSLWVQITADLAVRQRRMTLFQLQGDHSEVVQVVLNQDLSLHASPGVAYCRVRDQLYNELEIVVDTNDLLFDGAWHNVTLTLDDLEEDNMRFILDGVPLRSRVGLHTCPHKFDGWGAAGSGSGCIGGTGESKGDRSVTAHPLHGHVTELVVWAGDLVLYYWPLRGAQGCAAGDALPGALVDLQSGATIEPAGAAWAEAAFPDTCLVFAGDTSVNVGTLGNFGSRMREGLAIELWYRIDAKAWEARTDGKPGDGRAYGAPEAKEPAAMPPMTLLGVTDRYNKRQTLEIVANVDQHGEPRRDSIALRLADAEGRVMTAAIGSGSTGELACCTDGKWHRLLWTLADPASRTLRAEYDGRSVEVKTGAAELPRAFEDFTDALTLGALNDRGAPKNFLHGSLRSCRVWHGSRRLRLLRAGWRLDEGPGATIALDCTGNSHNGVVARVPPSLNNRRARRASSALKLRRLASELKLREAGDYSFKLSSWRLGPLPATDEAQLLRDIANQQALLEDDNSWEPGASRRSESGVGTAAGCWGVEGGYRASSFAAAGGEWSAGGGAKLLFVEVTAAEDETGAVRERVFDCLHDYRPSPCLTEPGPGGSLRVLDRFWEPVSGRTLLLALRRGATNRSIDRRCSHQVIILQGACGLSITLIQLRARPPSQRASLGAGGQGVTWAGPVQIAGPEAKRRHLLTKSVASFEAYLSKRTGGGRRASPPLAAGESAVTHALHWALTRRRHQQLRPELISVFAPRTGDDVAALALLLLSFRNGRRAQAAALIQAAWRSAAARGAACGRLQRQARLAELARAALSMEQYYAGILCQRYFESMVRSIGRFRFAGHRTATARGPHAVSVFM
ncbi:hypothetical protein DIPPA_12616 [Diplonema papillatum]|nr:hypothetical protein DIPPA_12616 [Diplonema papillatum]